MDCATWWSALFGEFWIDPHFQAVKYSRFDILRCDYFIHYGLVAYPIEALLNV